ncbi:exopolysaccharide biosynthesis polyprenyl glycosylphosphotransferase [Caloramator quimbayensis]|uniref:Exopolysaccharide biosynthesis polyprenyl glycosylphosphotransferase n=1 Tax=Caloramator quimbayensis TaxID=1147123 RepID=A0A1T4Y4J5_9CLOT|nr:sugar transferase [Caloramator quimbayensis]SKA96438.1 exopolysaccharide biosynthesis polyprenyl glycosylphosphotransferase [Caloramator quimbayensis]
MEGDILREIESSLNKKKMQFAIKRFFDIIFSLVLLIILSPLFLFISIWIKIDSEGEAVFKQTRIGLKGKPFTIYKFRTMVKNADKLFNKKVDKENLKNFVFQEKDDPRITKSGRFLRKTSLDELPQLINILKGDMSLIGPRPEIPDIVKLYSDYEKIRLLLKPGVSGLAQVNGRGELDIGQTIEYDVKYVKNFSLWLDFKIFLKTFKVVFMREGAY